MKNIKLLRVTNDYTQLKVQMETGISQSMLSKYESGDLIPTTENLMILADFYNTSLDYLMDRTAKRKNTLQKNKYIFSEFISNARQYPLLTGAMRAKADIAVSNNCLWQNTAPLT